MDKVCHFELPINEIERAKQFYKETFGWDIEQFGDMPYWSAKTAECDEQNMPKDKGCINGGLIQRDETNDPSGTKPVVVIEVSNTEDYCKKIEAAGGKLVLPARQVADMGIYARVEDTEGNVIGLWQNLKKQ